MFYKDNFKEFPTNNLFTYGFASFLSILENQSNLV